MHAATAWRTPQAPPSIRETIMPPPSHRIGVAVVLVLQGVATLGSLAGCGEQAPPLAPSSAATISGVSDPASSRVSPVLFDDAIGRILPSFADQVSATELRARLEDFAAAYESGDDRAARAAIAGARRLSEKGSAHAANLSALGLAIGRAEALLDSTTAAEAASHD
jgi:hypothetical protein